MCIRVHVRVFSVVWCLCFHSDERHPRPGKRSKTDDEDRSDEEDLNESNYDEVITGSSFG